MDVEGSQEEGGLLFSEQGTGGGGGLRPPLPRPRALSNHAMVRPLSTSDHVHLRDLTIVGSLGFGANGTVKKVLHTPSGRHLALKVIPLELRNKDSRRAIRAELEALYNSQNDNIIPCFGAYFSEGNVSIAMKFMDGGNLQHLAKATGTGVCIPALKIIARQSLAGMAYLHHKNLIHRDIKPANLLIGRDGNVVLSDFGTARIVEFSAPQTFVGTVHYMAPERLLGGKYTSASDVWSLGLTLLELALAVYPYVRQGWQDANESAGFVDLMDVICRSDPPLSGLDAEFDDLISRMLAKNENLRATCADLLQHPFLRNGMDECTFAQYVTDTLDNCRCPNCAPVQF